MSTDRQDWDRDEREALSGLEQQLDAMRRRHAADPPFELLRAAHHDALPPGLQDAVSDHLSGSAYSRTLADGVGADEPSLTKDETDRLFARIVKEAGRAHEPARAWGWFRPAIIGAAAIATASLVWFVAGRSEIAERLAPPETTVAVADPPALPPFMLPFEKPDVKLGMGALTWRGSTAEKADGNQLLADLKPGLDAYRMSDYASANRELTALASRYPGTVEILFYQGVSRLFLNDLAGAIASFEAAGAIGDRTFAADISWYRAVAEQRSGNLATARVRLEAICNARGADAARACAALEQLVKGSANPQ